MGDIFIKLVYPGATKNFTVCRFGFHTSFLTEKEWKDGDEQPKQPGFHPNAKYYELKLDRFLAEYNLHKNAKY